MKTSSQSNMTNVYIMNNEKINRIEDKMQNLDFLFKDRNCKALLTNKILIKEQKNMISVFNFSALNTNYKFCFFTLNSKENQEQIFYVSTSTLEKNNQSNSLFKCVFTFTKDVLRIISIENRKIIIDIDILFENNQLTECLSFLIQLNEDINQLTNINKLIVKQIITSTDLKTLLDIGRFYQENYLEENNYLKDILFYILESCHFFNNPNYYENYKDNFIIDNYNNEKICEYNKIIQYISFLCYVMKISCDEKYHSKKINQELFFQNFFNLFNNSLLSSFSDVVIEVLKLMLENEIELKDFLFNFIETELNIKNNNYTEIISDIFTSIKTNLDKKMEELNDKLKKDLNEKINELNDILKIDLNEKMEEWKNTLETNLNEKINELNDILKIDLNEKIKELNNTLETNLNDKAKELNNILETNLNDKIEELNNKLETNLNEKAKKLKNTLETNLNEKAKKLNDKLEIDLNEKVKKLNDKLEIDLNDKINKLNNKLEIDLNEKINELNDKLKINLNEKINKLNDILKISLSNKKKIIIKEKYKIITNTNNINEIKKEFNSDIQEKISTIRINNKFDDKIEIEKNKFNEIKKNQIDNLLIQLNIEKTKAFKRETSIKWLIGGIISIFIITIVYYIIYFKKGKEDKNILINTKKDELEKNNSDLQIEENNNI